MNMCLRCDYLWVQRKLSGRVKQCPYCHSPKWDVVGGGGGLRAPKEDSNELRGSKNIDHGSKPDVQRAGDSERSSGRQFVSSSRPADRESSEVPVRTSGAITKSLLTDEPMSYAGMPDPALSRILL